MNEVLELIRCAQINFQNLENASPYTAQHPYYKIAKMQLDEVVTKLEDTIDKAHR